MLLRSLLFWILTGLLACSSSQSARPSSDTVQITDRKPVAFSGRQPASYPVRGMDAARFQTFVDWPSAKKAGIEFVFLKATEGGDLKDSMFRNHWRDAGRAGIARGAYHFYYFCTPPDVQARWFIRNVPRSQGAMPPVLDMEWNPFSPTCQRRPDDRTVRAEMQLWLDTVEAAFGRRPIIYTTPGFYKDAGLSNLKGYEFWLRTTSRRPEEVYPGQSWRFWQYTATGGLPNTPGDIDINVFNGTRADWEAWLTEQR